MDEPEEEATEEKPFDLKAELAKWKDKDRQILFDALIELAEATLPDDEKLGIFDARENFTPEKLGNYNPPRSYTVGGVTRRIVK